LVFKTRTRKLYTGKSNDFYDKPRIRVTTTISAGGGVTEGGKGRRISRKRRNRRRIRKRRNI